MNAMTDSIGDGAFRLPSWYGSSQTPYDYQPPSRLAQSGEDGRLRVLLDAGTSLSLSLQINYRLIYPNRKFELWDIGYGKRSSICSAILHHPSLYIVS